MPHPGVAAIEALSVDLVELSHASRKIPLQGLQQQMGMVVHQAVRMAPQVITCHYLLQASENRPPILIVAIDSLAGSAAGGDVVEGARID